MPTQEAPPLAPLIGLTPEEAARIEDLPEHIVDHLGDIALQLSHEDMFHKKEGRGEYGGTVLVADFEKLINDPQSDSNELSAEALEAAKRGQKETSAVFAGGAELIKSAHDDLTEKGMKFGATDLETDDARTAREQAEKEAIYKLAIAKAVEQAKAAKANGDSEGAQRALESSFLLGHMKGEMDRQAFRAAVKAGLTDELLKAAQASDKIFLGTDYSKINHSLWRQKEILEFMTGKVVKSDFTLTDYEISSPQIGLDKDTHLDLLAAMTTEGAWLTPEKGFDISSHHTDMILIQKNYDPTAAAGEPGSLQYFEQLINEIPESIRGGDLETILNTDDPMFAIQGANELGIETWKFTSLFGTRAEGEYVGKLKLNKPAYLQMVALQKAYPEKVERLFANPNDFGFSLGPDGAKPAEIQKSFDAIDPLDANSDELIKEIIRQSDSEKFLAKYELISSACHEEGVSIDEAFAVFSKLGKNARELFEVPDNKERNFSKELKNLFISGETFDTYAKELSEMELPITDYIRLNADQLPRLREGVESLGLPPEIAGEIIESWLTYNAQAVFFNSRKSSEALTQNDINYIAKNQVKAIFAQLQSLQKMVESYGIDTTKEIIDVFGIYNFSRYVDEVDGKNELVDQLERWKRGDKVNSVVVNARSDWNDYVGNKTVFEDEVDDGVFYFESSTGAGAARVAVTIGKHEQSASREPDVKRFIIHGHANPSGITMGPKKGQDIDVSGYKLAAFNARKIGAKEHNDFKRHLGQNFEVILQGCSTGGESLGMFNIRDVMEDNLETEVAGSGDSISSLRIKSDGSIVFVHSGKEVETITS